MSGKGKSWAEKIGLINSSDEAGSSDGKRSSGAMPPPAPPPVPMSSGIPVGNFSMPAGQVDSGMLERMRAEVDKAATPAFHAFMDQVKALKMVPGMVGVNGEATPQCIAAAIATCKFPKSEILKGVRDRADELERIAARFNQDVESARTSQLGAKDTAIKQLDDRITDRQKQVDTQIAMLQKQIDDLRTSTKTDIENLTSQKTAAQTERATLEQQLNASVVNFTSTSASLRTEISAQTAQFSAALA